MVQAKVIEVGEQAFSDKTPMVILFGETATEELKKYSVIQKVEQEPSFQLKKGDYLRINNTSYSVDYVGSVANDNLNSISHVTLIFSEVPETDQMANALYLSPHVVPQMNVGTQIEYLSSGV